MSIVFVHGWGFDARFWDSVCNHLPEGTESIRIDLGFTKNADIPKLPENTICVGHSLGVLWLLKHVQNPKALVSINGFDCFYKFTPDQNLQIMQRQIQRRPERQMREFYKACGASFDEDTEFDQEALFEGLTWLREWDLSDEKNNLSCPLRVIASRDDQIVPASASQEMWRDIVWKETGGHVLPLTHSEFCAQHIMEVTNGI